MPPPPPKHRGREATAGMPPPERRLQAPLVGSGSSGGAMAPPEHRLKALSVGSGFSGGAMPPPEGRGKGTGSIGETPLANLSNLIGSPGFPIKQPPATATQPQRVARERNYARPWSSSSPRNPSVRTGPQPRSAKTCHRRFSLLSINDVGPPTSQAPLRNAAGAAATRLQPLPLEKPGTCLSGGRMPSSPSASLSGARMPSSPCASLSRARMPSSPSTSLSGARMPTSPSTSLSGARMLPSPRLTMKAGAGLIIETPREHYLATSSPQKRQAVTGSPRKHQAVTGSPRKHQAITGSPQKHQVVTGSPQKHQGVTGSPQKHQAVAGSPQKHQAAMSSPQKHQAGTGSLQKHPATGSPQSSPHKDLNVTRPNDEKPRKHRSVRGFNAETPQKHQGVLVSSGPTLQMDRIKDKVGGGSCQAMAQKNYSKERTGPSNHLSSARRTGTVTELQATSAKHLFSHHLSSTRRIGTVTELQATSGKRLNKNTSFAKKSSLRTNQKLRRSSSQFDGSNGRLLDADHGNTTAEDNKGSTAKDDGCLTEEMIRNIQKVDHTIQQLNELGHGEDISYEEFEGYLEGLPMPTHVDTSFRPNYEQLNEFQIRNILYHIKYCKFTRQKRMDDEMLYKLEDDHPLYCLEEKLECLEEDISKLEGDNLLYYLEKEGVLSQIENDDLFDWSFHYDTIDGLDDYQRLIPQNYGGHEYVRWDTYRDYFHSYEIELEYLMYWKELLKELKWMEDYVLLKPCLKWGKICTRGCFQAVKIASRFSKITESLARGAYYDCIDTMCLDIIWYKELDGVYFEIWQRMTMLKENFKEALNEVFISEKFPLRHEKMKDALENGCSEMEKEFRACTAGITAEVKEDSARELIADALKNKRGRPKFYAQYIRKKIEVAKAIGVIPAVVT